MSKFCMYCGKALEEGAVCDCQQPVQQPASVQQPVYQQPVQIAPAKPSPIGEAFKNMFPFIKSYFTNPKEAVLNGAKSNLILAIIFVAIFASTFIIGKLLSVADTALSVEGMKMSIPFIQIFLTGIIDASLWVGLSTLVLFVIAKMFGGNINFKEAFTAVGLQTFVPTALILLSGISAFIDTTFASYIYNLAIIVWTVTMAFDIINYIDSVTEAGKKFIATLAAIGIAIGFFTFISGKLDLWIAKNIEFKSISYEDILEDYADDLADTFEDFDF